MRENHCLHDDIAAPRTLPASARRNLRARGAARIGVIAAAAVAALWAGVLGGCERKAFLYPAELVDPDQSNQLRSDGTARPRIQTILTELDLGVSVVPEAFTNVRAVQAGDLEVNAQDYRIGPADLVQVSISDLGPGQTAYVQPLRVSDTGLLNLPDLPPQYRQLRIAGMTEVEAAAQIATTYVDAGVFTEPPQVTLLVIEPNSKAFNITGNVQAPARYVLVKSDFRLLDAIVTARGSPDPNINSEWAYVIRTRQSSAGTQPVAPDRGDPLRPRSSIEPDAIQREWPFEDPAPATGEATFASAQGGGAGAQPRSGGFEFQPPQEPSDTEIIRVPLKELLQGQLKYNLVIRPEDTIILPAPITGEYFVGGHVNAPGAFLILPGRKLTMKQAIITARMPDEVSVPGRTQLVRRINDQDVFVRVDLTKVFVGTEPDIYLQPNDIIMVGTNAIAPFLAAFRNAFRVTYGFGFIYDRNFAYSRSTPRLF